MLQCFDCSHAAHFVNRTLAVRVVTTSERHLVRLRIWLGRRMFKHLGSSGLCRFGPQTVLKFTSTTRFSEAANMEFIASHTCIPVPRVHDVFIIDRQTYIVMEYIDAPELTKVWGKLTAAEKEGIFVQLKNFITQLRSLESPHPGRVEAADGSGVFDSRLCMGSRPFATVDEFHTQLGHRSLCALEMYRQHWPLIETMGQKQYRTVFTHSDISPRNILVKDGSILAIIDWECSGWYPEYWEYTRWADSNFRSPQMWLDKRDEILDVYTSELLIESLLDSVYTRL